MHANPGIWILFGIFLSFLFLPLLSFLQGVEGINKPTFRILQEKPM